MYILSDHDKLSLINQIKSNNVYSISKLIIIQTFGGIINI